MTARAHRSLLALLLLIGVIATAFALMSMHTLGVAHADPSNGLTVLEPAPVDQAVDGSRVVGWWRGGQFVLVGIIVVFVALRAAHQRIPWLAAGNRGVYVAAALAGLAVIVEAANRGTTPTIELVATAIGTAYALLTKTPPVPLPAPKPEQPAP